MRWVFFSLLGANVIYVIWLFFAGSTGGAASANDRVKVQAAPDVASLVLLAERKDVDEQVAATQTLLPLARPEREVEALCTLVGPFTDIDMARAMAENLRALEIAAAYQQVEVPEGEGYWVYLQPADSRKAALVKLQELQAKAIDSYVIPKGELANGISFGMFSRRELAERRKEEMVNLGYAAEIREIKRSHKENWVMLQPGEADKVADELWSRYRQREPNLDIRQNYCLGVASE